jgi:PAS domain S-box-containing protein
MKLLKYSLTDKAFLNNLIEENSKIKAQIEDATNFVKDIENGKLDKEYKKEEYSDNPLLTALLSMQNQLKKISEEEKNRTWATEGLAKFADILRGNNDNINYFGDSIISNLVKYLNANQGGIFVLNEDEKDHVYLELIACYAYNRKKFIEKRIEIGEGLVGQTFIEKETIYMTELPKAYTTITSGLGDATPSCLVLIPLKTNDTILGVIEIASFELLESFKIDFLERLAESIASALTSVRVAYKTEALLRESQEQTELLRSQEEEVRQNMEELAATQEEMHRVLKEAQGQEKYLHELINVPKDSIFTIDRDFKVMSYNKSFTAALEMSGVTVSKGFDFLQLFPDEKEKNKQRALYNRAFKGETFEQTDQYELNGTTMYYLANYAPLYNEEKEIIAVASFSKDVTALIEAQKATEELLLQSKQQAEEMQAQEEELRQNMEELSATQEEMQRVFQEAQGQEKYLTELINVPKDTIFTIDKDFKVISYNKSFTAALEMSGVTVSKGFDFLQLFPTEEEKNNQKALYERAFKGENFEQTDHYELNGTTMYYLANYAPLYNAEKEIIAVASFSKDVTALIEAQKATEEMLLQSKQQAEEMHAQEKELRQNMKESVEQKEYMQNFINASEDAILAVDKDLKMLVFNDQLVSFFNGQGVNVQKGKSIGDYLNPTNKEAQLTIYKRTLKGEKFNLIKQYGDKILEIKYNPIKHNNGEIIGVCCFTRDITDFEKDHPDIKAEINKIK